MNEGLIFRIDVLIVMVGGQLISLLSEAYRKDIATPDQRLTIRMWLWEDAQKWKVLGAYVLLLELAFIIPHQALHKLMLIEFYEIPVGYVGVAGIGFLADDIFFALDALARKYIKGKFNGHRLNGEKKRGETGDMNEKE